MGHDVDIAKCVLWCQTGQRAEAKQDGQRGLLHPMMLHSRRREEGLSGQAGLACR